MPELSKVQAAALSASLAIAAGIGIGSVGRSDAPDVPEAPVPEVQPADKPFDVKAYNTQVRAYRAQHPSVIDLLTASVQPGDQVTTGVNVALGGRPARVEPIGSWSIDGVSFEDRASSTWIEVKATNTGDMAARFMGFVEVP